MKYEKYTKLVIPKYITLSKIKRKIKNELIPFDANHDQNRGAYQRVQIRYEDEYTEICFLGYDKLHIMDCIKNPNKPENPFFFNFGIDDIDLERTNENYFSRNKYENGCIYKYSISELFPFNQKNYPTFEKWREQYFSSVKIQHFTDQYFHTWVGIYLEKFILYFLSTIKMYTEDELNDLHIRIEKPINHKIITFETKLTSLSFIFYSNLYIPPDFNLGNNVSYGYGSIRLLDQMNIGFIDLKAPELLKKNNIS